MKSLLWMLILGYLHWSHGNETVEEVKGVLVMDGLSIHSEDDLPKLIGYGNYSAVLLKNVDILSLEADVLAELVNLTQLSIKFGELASIDIPEQLTSLDISSCKTRAVVIDPQGDYSLQKLYIHHSQLTDIPDHLNALRNLKELVLNDNAIESVDMANFQGLDLLETIALQRNKIHHIKTSSENPVILPSLTSLYLDQNQLPVLSFADWIAPEVKTVHLHRNSLAVVDSLLSAFPELKTVMLNRNPLNCSWSKNFAEQAKERAIVIKEGIGCEGDADDGDASSSSEEGWHTRAIPVYPREPVYPGLLDRVINSRLEEFNRQMESMSGKLQRQMASMQDKMDLLQVENIMLKSYIKKIANAVSIDIGLDVKGVKFEFEQEE